MMDQRKIGSRELTPYNLPLFLGDNVHELDLNGFWVIDDPFVHHYNCIHLTYLNLYVIIFIRII